MKKILVSGSSGFIGKALLSYLNEKRCTVLRLVRKKDPSQLDTIYWNPEEGEIDPEQLIGIDEVIHLAGSPIFQGRWTAQKKEKIFLSRCRDTWLLAKAFAQLKKPPSYFFSASAVGYYGSQAGKLLTESSPPGNGFLAEVCLKWESASNLLEKNGTRVVYGRFGVVLSPKGGLLAKVLPIFRCGLGGRLGAGTQWMSWISLEDLIRAIDFTRKHSNLAGSFNFTSPNPVTNGEFTKILAESLRRPAFFHLPRSILRFMFGELADEALLSSTRAMPRQLLADGFSFQHPSLTDIFNYI